MRAAAIAVILASAACSRPVRTARLSASEPPSLTEIEDAQSSANAACSRYWALAFPGLGHACLRRPRAAAVLAGLGGAELGAAAWAYSEYDAESSAVMLPLLAFQDLWAIGVVDSLLVAQRGNFERFAPQDSHADLLLAPVNSRVLAEPRLWLGLAGMLAVGITASIVLSDGIDGSELGDEPVVFGKRRSRAWAYPAAGAAGVGLFSHVAIAEELIFRGWLQSSLARSWGEQKAWVTSSLLFGAVHLGNAAALEEQDRMDYIVYGLPIITAGGFYLGWLYKESGYSLAAPVAMHFWYDLLLSATLFALDPDDSLVSARVSLPL